MVTSFDNMFKGAELFTGKGLDVWITSSLVSLFGTFEKAAAMNVDLRSWQTTGVTTMYQTFFGATTFVGAGLDEWDTVMVTDLSATFKDAPQMNSDLSAWNVAKVTKMAGTFRGAEDFVGTGLRSWNVAKVTDMDGAFRNVAKMNSYLGEWKVAEVTSLAATFSGASKFDGSGLTKWDVAKVARFKDTSTLTFNADKPTSLTSCRKREIADAWKSNLAFNSLGKFGGNYVTDWASETCAVRLRFARAAYARTLLCIQLSVPYIGSYDVSRARKRMYARRSLHAPT